MIGGTFGVPDDEPAAAVEFGAARGAGAKGPAAGGFDSLSSTLGFLMAVGAVGGRMSSETRRLTPTLAERFFGPVGALDGGPAEGKIAIEMGRAIE